MIKYVALVKQHLVGFSTWKLEHVPKVSNEKAYALAVVAASFPIMKTIFMSIYYQSDSSIATIRVNQVGETSPSSIEAEAFASIKDKEVTQFIWKNIVYRFGIPRKIISDNGPQFDSRVYRNFCHELKIKNLYSTPRYP